MNSSEEKRECCAIASQTLIGLNFDFSNFKLKFGKIHDLPLPGISELTPSKLELGLYFGQFRFYIQYAVSTQCVHVLHQIKMTLLLQLLCHTKVNSDSHHVESSWDSFERIHRQQLFDYSVDNTQIIVVWVPPKKVLIGKTYHRQQSKTTCFDNRKQFRAVIIAFLHSLLVRAQYRIDRSCH